MITELNLKSEAPITVALQAAKMGFPVFPTDSATKRPLINNWPNVATRDPDQIHVWWNQFPKAMIGAVTGHASGFFVLDIDVKGNEDAFEKLENFKKAHEGLPPTMTVQTASGGLHLYFSMPEGVDIRNTAGKLGLGIDVRGNGGYVVFPGSVRADGQSYKIV